MFQLLVSSNEELITNDIGPLALNIFIAIVPSVLLCAYVYFKDEIEKEPLKMLFTLFFLGVLITVPASFVENSILDTFDLTDNTDLVSCLILSFLVVGLVEEGYKFVITYFGSWRSKEFNHVYDAIVYATFVSLGFATLENILYVLRHGTETALVRSIISVPAHAFYAISCGYYLGLSKLNYSIGNRSKGKMYKFLAFIVPVLMHGLFDFLLLTNNNELIWMFFAFVAILYVVSFFNIRRLASVQMTSSIQKER